MRLHGAHLEAAELVDAVLCALLRHLAEDGGHRLEHALHPRTVVRTLVELPCSLTVRDARRGHPRGGEEQARSVPLEVRAEEVRLLLLPDGSLLGHQRPQLLKVLGRAVRGHEVLALRAPVGERRVEQALEEAQVLLTEDLRGAVQVPEESAARGKGKRARSTALRLRQVEASEIQVNATRSDGGNPGDRCAVGETLLPAPEQAAGRGRTRERARGNGQRRATCAQCRTRHHGTCKAHLDASVEPVLLDVDALVGIDNLSVPHLDLRVATLIPELGNLQAAFLIGLHIEAEPRVLDEHFVVHQELGKHGCLRKLAQVIDHALALCDEVKTMLEGLGVLHQGVVSAREECVLEAARTGDLLAGLDTHVYARDQGVLLRQVHLGPPDDEPLSGVPLNLLPLLLREIKAALHANHRLHILAHGKLLQVHVRLEHGLSEARACKPSWLKSLHLPEGLRTVQAGLLWVQGEHGLAAITDADLQGQRQVFHIQCRCGVHRGRDAGHVALLVKCQCVHAVGCHGKAHLLRAGEIPWHLLEVPANTVLIAPAALPLGVAALAGLLLTAGALQHQLGLALSMQKAARLVAAVGKVTNRQGTFWAEHETFLLVCRLLHLLAVQRHLPLCLPVRV
mmetsp:Transcript_88053/g.233778  ORF Transcript_88053/g.233778 Transcript_88053/m.233778 type:complete len:624 (+) Transcript_88053:547-2418(+)